MTALLAQAFAEAAKRPEAEQDVLAARLLAELAAEDEFDWAIAASPDKLALLAHEALAEHRAGRTEELDEDRLAPVKTNSSSHVECRWRGHIHMSKISTQCPGT